MKRVRIIRTFEVIRQLGPLVVKSLAGEEPTEDIIDGPREFRHTFKEGTTATFQSKKAAKEFCETHAGKVEML